MTLGNMIETFGLTGGPFLIIFGAILAGIFGERFRAEMNRKAWRGRRARSRSFGWQVREVGRPKADIAAPTPFDAAEQLRCVTVATFKKQRLLNKSEARLLYATERAVIESGLPWRVMAQVSLGEVLSSPDERAYRAINSKRVDILIIGNDGEPVVALEYQGKGHHQGNAAVRDAVKKEALRRAGIGYIEVNPGDQPSDIRRHIAKLGFETVRKQVAQG